MKNVTPKAGQAWEVLNIGKSKVTKTTDEYVWFVGHHVNHCWHTHQFIGLCKFVPQNDLEWLAINEPEWFHNDCTHIRRNGESVMYTDCPRRKVLAHHNWVDRQRWQNMRYELGLDDKPKHSQGGPVGPNIMFKTLDGAELIKQEDGTFICVKGHVTAGDLITQKETKMIDLSSAKVGDKYKGEGGGIYTLDFVGDSYFVFKNENNLPCFVEVNGGFQDYRHSKLLSKYNSRPWLKDLPDADVFALYEAVNIQCNKSGIWFDNLSRSLGGSKMPTLTGDQWRDSKISIDELREWQEQNKC